MKSSRGSDGAFIVDATLIPLLLGIDCIIPSQRYYEDVCKVRYQGKEVEKCISRIRYVFSTMRSTGLIYEVDNRSVVFLPCISFFYEAYGEKWREKFIKYLRRYVHPFYSSEDIQYLYLDEKELDTALNKACRLVEEFPELKALIANLVEHYKSMRQLHKLMSTTTIYNKLDEIFEEMKRREVYNLDNLKFQLYSLISRQKSILTYVTEMLVLLLVMESLRSRGYLNSEHLLDLYFGVVKNAIKDRRIKSIVEPLKTIHASFSRTLQIVEDMLKKRYAGKSKGMANKRSVTRKMMASFVVSRSFMSIELVRTMLSVIRELNR